MTARQIVVAVSVLILATAFVLLVPGSDEEPTPVSAIEPRARPNSNMSQPAKRIDEAPELLVATSERSPKNDIQEAVHYGQSIYNFDLDYQQRAQAAAEAYLAPWGAEAVLRWRPLHVDPNAVLLADYMQPDAMPERLIFSPFEDMVFEAVRTDYKIRGVIESARWEGRLVGAHTGRVELVIVGGESNPSFVLKIVSGPDDQPMIYSIRPTLDSDVYVAIEGNPHWSPRYEM